MKKKKLPSLVSILILTLITVVMWVSFEVYWLFNKPVAPVVPESISAPLDPILDQAVINQIESAIYFEDSELNDQVATETKAETDTKQEDEIPVDQTATP